MLVTIHQPQFMPWLGFFDKMDTAKVTKDYSMFRLIVNFVNEKKRRVEQE